MRCLGDISWYWSFQRLEHAAGLISWLWDWIRVISAVCEGYLWPWINWIVLVVFVLSCCNSGNFDLYFFVLGLTHHHFVIWPKSLALSLCQWISRSCYIDFPQLIQWFFQVVMWICQTCYVKDFTWICKNDYMFSSPLPNKTKLKFEALWLA